MNTRILIMAGGTGGHVFPALAIAEQLECEGWQVLWLGTRAGLETDIVSRAGIPIKYISVTGLRGKKSSTLLLAPFRLLKAFFQSLVIILKYKPTIVLGMGGFVAGPGAIAAGCLRVPLIIHEQNAVPGTTNRILARVAKRILCAFPEAFNYFENKTLKVPSPNLILTGNPVRKTLTTLPQPEIRFQDRKGPLRLLVLGGSRGAQVLNDLCPKAIALLAPSMQPEVRHQAGALNVRNTIVAYQNLKVTAEVVPFMQDMALAYAWADLVLCRAGALTISELGTVGIGSILVPFPFAIDDHQWHNAQSLKKAGASIVIRQQDLTPECLADYLMRFTEDRACILKMAVAAKKAFCLDATDLVIKACKEVAYAT